MKKLGYIILAASIFALSSCSLEKYQSGVIGTENALETVNDAANMTNYLYLSLRGLYSGSYIYNNDLPTDEFHAAYGFGNRGGTFYRWEWTSSDGAAEGIWSHCYYATANANFILEGIAKIEAKNTALTDAEKASLTKFKGICHFVKAATMFELATRFCSVYSSETASDEGVMLVDKYNPTSDQTQYPGRSTLQETYDFITNNLDEAETLLANETGAVGSQYLTIDAVKAMYARVALFKGDYDKAISKATALIGAGKYPLVSSAEEFNALWTNDSGKECIMQLYANYKSNSLPASCSYNYISESADGLFSPDYIPTSATVALFKEYPTDLRWNNWFAGHTLTYGTVKGDAYICTKYPGNPDLQDASQKTSSYINKIKVLRIAEQYLIAAEAYAKKSDATNADKYLNALRKARISGYVEKNYTGDQLISEIKKERQRELFAEGFRFTDLKRYGDSFTRSAAQNTEIISNAGGSTTEFLSIESSNYRYLWPIPQVEIDANPQIKDHQNPGYSDKDK